GLEVQGHAANAARKLDHLTSLNIVEAVDTRDAVADRENLADLAHFRFGTEILNLALQDGGYFGGLNVHGSRSFDRRAFSFRGWRGGCRSTLSAARSRSSASRF